MFPWPLQVWRRFSALFNRRAGSDYKLPRIIHVTMSNNLPPSGPSPPYKTNVQKHFIPTYSCIAKTVFAQAVLHPAPRCCCNSARTVSAARILFAAGVLFPVRGIRAGFRSAYISGRSRGPALREGSALPARSLVSSFRKSSRWLRTLCRARAHLACYKLLLREQLNTRSSFGSLLPTLSPTYRDVYDTACPRYHHFRLSDIVYLDHPYFSGTPVHI